MLDVAAVAEHFLDKVLPPSTRELLLSLHPSGDMARSWVLFFVAAHDIGKAAPPFQRKVSDVAAHLQSRGLKMPLPSKRPRHHGDAGMLILKAWIEREYGGAPAGALLARAVAAHHGQFPRDATIERRLGRKESGESAWSDVRDGILATLATHFEVADLGACSASPAHVMMFAGFTSMVDWIGSMQSVFEYEAPVPNLDAHWARSRDRAVRACHEAGFAPTPRANAKSFRELFRPHSPWPLHETAERLASELTGPSLVVIEAPMGEGKTEASLLFANQLSARLGQSGLFIGLPTRATANQMFGRVLRFLEQTADSPVQLVLAHAEASLVEAFADLRFSSVHDPQDQREAAQHTIANRAVRAGLWFSSKKRALLAGHAIGTIDQSLLTVLRTGHAFVRYFGLAGKTVVLDEVHAYDTYTGRLLDRLLDWLGAAGTSVILLSATLPSCRRRELLAAYHRGLVGEKSVCPELSAAYPRITIADAHGVHESPVGQRRDPVAVSLETRDDDVDALVRELVEETARGGCIAVICNTVKRAQDVFHRLKQASTSSQLLLLHSRLFPDERRAREVQLEAWLGPPSEDRVRPESCVVVGTQVLEQSLDVDFDLMFTDIAPVDLVLQRAGRLHRHARTDRHAVRSAPELRVIQPSGDVLEVPLESVAIVYLEYFVRRTMQALANLQGRVELPTDIEPLIEEVYTSKAPSMGSSLHKAYIEAMGVKLAQGQGAEQGLVTHPDKIDFGDLQVFLDEDDDPAKADELRARTRDARPSISIVCVERRDGELVVDRFGATSLTLNPDAAPNRELLDALVRRSINVTRPKLVHTLAESETHMPKPWRQSALLRHRRLVVFEESQAEVADEILTLDPDLGLVFGATQ